MARTKHRRDHLMTGDETFLYRGELPKQLAQEFIERKSRTRILCLKGGTSSGKTRTAKDLVREMQIQLEGEKQEVYTFYFDLKHYGTVETLRGHILTTLKTHVPGFNLARPDTLFSAFREIRNGLERIFLFVVDNLDKVKDENRSTLLSFIEDVVQQTENVHLVLPSRKKVKFVRIPRKVWESEMRPMEPEDAKELLKDASGNPKDLERHAGRIVDLVCKLPLALMIAGYEMNETHTSFPYSPEEFVELMEDSATRTLGLDNVPEEDRLCETIEYDASKYYSILEKVLFAVEDPESFDLNELKNSMNDISSAHLKQSILRILLDSSLFTVHRTEEDGVSSFKSSPLLMKIFCEVFCKVSCRDSFLKEFNSALCETVGDEKELKSAKADGVRKAEMLLRKRQREGCCSPEKVRALREGIVKESTNFLELVFDDVSKSNNFKRLAYDIINKVESSEREDCLPTQSGIQETSANSAGLSQGSQTSRDPEAEARVSPSLPSSVKWTDPMKESPRPSGKGAAPNGNDEEEEFSRFHTLSSSDNGDQTFCSSEYVSNGLSDVFQDDRTNPVNLAEDMQQSLNLHGSPVSSDVDDKKHPDIHHVTQDSGSGASYSLLSTMADKQVLTFQNGDATGEEERVHAESRGTENNAKSLNNQPKEAIESEFDWEKSDCNAEDEAQSNEERLPGNPVQGTASERKHVQEKGGVSASEVERPVVQERTMQQESRSHSHSQYRGPHRSHHENLVPGNAGQMPHVNRGDQPYFGSSHPVSPGGFNQYRQPEGFGSSGIRPMYHPSGFSSPSSSFVPRGPPQHESFGSSGYQQTYPHRGVSSPTPSFRPRGPPGYSLISDQSSIHSLHTHGFEHYPDGNPAYPNDHHHHHGFQQSPGPAAYVYGRGEQYHGADGGQYGYHYHHQQQQQQYGKYNSQVRDSEYHRHQNNQGNYQNTQQGHYQDNRGHHQNNRGHHQDNRGHHQDNRGHHQNNRGDYQDYRGDTRGRGRVPDRYNKR